MFISKVICIFATDIVSPFNYLTVMAEEKNNEQPKKRKKRGKTEKQKKLLVLKEILNKGLETHKRALDDVIQQYTDYTKLAEYEEKQKELEKKIKLIKESIKTSEEAKSKESK